jgi:hypothetical protein
MTDPATINGDLSLSPGPCFLEQMSPIPRGNTLKCRCVLTVTRANQFGVIRMDSFRLPDLNIQGTEYDELRALFSAANTLPEIAP